jgi:hypothetical protein
MEDASALVDWNWFSVRGFLPFDLDGLAVETGVLKRRRGVVGGEALVRALLLTALPKMTLRRASVMAREAGIAELNPVALFKRLRAAEPLLEAALSHALGYAVGSSETWQGYRLLAADATPLAGPGSKGTDQRLHVLYDLGRCSPLQMELTDAKGGETLARYNVGPGDLLLGDRGYAFGKSLLAALGQGAKILIRMDFANLRILDDRGEKIWEEQALGALGDAPDVSFTAYLPGLAMPLRVIGGRNREGRGVWLLTNLDEQELPTCQARELYSRRWQIELFFKRLKSILDLDELPTRDGPTARPWIWAKLLLATLAVLVAHERFSPWGAPVHRVAHESVATRRPRVGRAVESLARPHEKTQARQTQETQRTTRHHSQATLLLEA